MHNFVRRRGFNKLLLRQHAKKSGSQDLGSRFYNASINSESLDGV